MNPGKKRTHTAKQNSKPAEVTGNNENRGLTPSSSEHQPATGNRQLVTGTQQHPSYQFRCYSPIIPYFLELVTELPNFATAGSSGPCPC